MVNEKHYVVIQGWMTKLDIKGNALIAFACIYGFSQAEDTWFTGSAQYIADWCGISRNAVLDILNQLVAKGYIVKKDILINGVHFCNYRENLQGTKKDNIGSQETLQGGSQETLHHNTNTQNTIINSSETIDAKKKQNRTRKEIIYPTLDEVTKYVKEKNLSINPNSFYEYYSKLDWFDANGNKVKNWKCKAVRWNINEKDRHSPYSSPSLKSSSAPAPRCNFEMDEA